jgi:hypothetical protein
LRCVRLDRRDQRANFDRHLRRPPSVAQLRERLIERLRPRGPVQRRLQHRLMAT